MLGRIFPIETINYHCRRELQKRMPNTWGNNVGIAILSGTTASTVMYPLDILRQFMNNQTSGGMSVTQAVRDIYGKYGLKYFYKGYANMLLTIATYRAFYNGTYDTNKGRASNLYEKAGIAYLSTVFAESVIYPIEIVRRRRIVINSN